MERFFSAWLTHKLYYWCQLNPNPTRVRGLCISKKVDLYAVFMYGIIFFHRKLYTCFSYVVYLYVKPFPHLMYSTTRVNTHHNRSIGVYHHFSEEMYAHTAEDGTFPKVLIWILFINFPKTQDRTYNTPCGIARKRTIYRATKLCSKLHAGEDPLLKNG